MTLCSNISVNELVRLGYDENIIRNGIQESLAGNSSHWKGFYSSDHCDFLIDVHTIPKNLTCIEGFSPESLEILSSLDQELINLLLSAKANYGSLMNQYKSYEGTDKQHELALKHSVLRIAWNFRYQRGFNLNRLGVLMWKHGFRYYKSYKSLSNILCAIEKRDGRIGELLIDPRKGREGKRRITQPMIDLINYWALYGKSSRKIRDEINRCFFQDQSPISKRTIQNYITDETKQLSKYIKFGIEWVRLHQDYILRKKCNNLFQVVEADGSRFQIPFYDSIDNKVVWLSFFVIIDVCSGAILSASIGYYENSEMVIEAFHGMVKRHGYLPSAIAVDNSSAIKSRAFKVFRQKIERKYGTIFLIHEPGAPNKKGTVESFFRTFHAEICSDNEAYAGLGGKCHSDRHKLSRAIIKDIYDNRKKLYKVEDASILLQENLELFNNTSFSNIEAPNVLLTKRHPLHAIKISESEQAYLFWHRSKRYVNKSKIELKGGYRIKDFGTKLFEKWVYVFHHPENTNVVYLFNKDDNYLCMATKKREVIYDPRSLSVEDRLEIREAEENNKDLSKKIKQKTALIINRGAEVLSTFPEADMMCADKKESMRIFNQLADREYELLNGRVFSTLASKKMITS